MTPMLSFADKRKEVRAQMLKYDFPEKIMPFLELGVLMSSELNVTRGYTGQTVAEPTDGDMDTYATITNETNKLVVRKSSVGVQ